MKSDFFSQKAVSIARIFSFSLLLFFSSHLKAQTPPCDEIVLVGAGNPSYDDDCFRVEVPFFFEYTGMASPEPTTFETDQIIIRFTLVGNAAFDYDMFITDLPGYVEVHEGDEKHFVVEGPCGLGTFEFTFGDHFLNAFVIAEPGEDFDVLTEVDAYYLDPPFDCGFGSNNCDNDEIESSDLIGIEKDVPSSCGSDYSIRIEGLPVGPVDPHQEVQLYLVFQNRTGSPIDLSEMDFRLRISDVYGNLEAISLDPASVDPPLISSIDGDEYYFFINSFEGGTTVASMASKTVLSFSISPPSGIANLLGEADIELLAAHVNIDGVTCCTLDPSSAEGTVNFPGELPCEGGSLEDVHILIDEATGLVNCEVGFVIIIDSPDEWDAERLLIDLSTVISGSLQIVDVVPHGAFTSCGGCLSYTSNSVTFDFDDPLSPISISNLGIDYLVVVLDGLNGSLDEINFRQIAIQVDGVTDACIPEVDYYNDFDLTLPIETPCNYCDNIYVSTEDYVGFVDIDDCEQGFSVALKTSGAVFDEIFVQFQISNPDHLDLDIESLLCSSNTLACTSSGTVTPDPCVSYEPSTGIVTYHYCKSTGINTANNDWVPLVNIKGTGLGCLTGVTFLSSTEVGIYGSIHCNPQVYGHPSVSFPICTDCPDTEFTISGNIHDENGLPVIVPISPTGGNIEDKESGIYFINAESAGTCNLPSPNPGCIEVESTPVPTPCDGNYTITFECEDEEFNIIPKKDLNPLNGVTTFDIVLLTKHIIGDPYFDSPYKLIAADANHSGVVTTFDIVQIRKLILFQITEFDNSPSWRFVDAAEVLTYPMDNYTVPSYTECVHVDLSSDNAITGIDFIAVKIGDVNNSNQHCNASFVGDDTESRSSKISVTAVNDHKLTVGKTANVEFWMESQKELVSWEMGMKFDTILHANRFCANVNI